MSGVTVHQDELEHGHRRVVAEVPSSWRRDTYWIDLFQGVWYCTCWRNPIDRPGRSCAHVKVVKRQVGE